jgi:DNA modification methylase
MIELNKIYNEDCRDTMKRMDDNSIDSIVTDPPYELGFMGKKWDNSGIAYNVELWEECLRVLKPGGYLLAFGGTRTSHRMVCAIEDAGFEIRDSILWLYGSGFPKNMDISKQIDKEAGNERIVIGKRTDGRYATQGTDIRSGNFVGGKDKIDIGIITEPASDDSKQWQGFGTALKPAHEPICVARKPISEKTVAENVLKYGTGGINIDGCRIETDEDQRRSTKGGDNGLNGSSTFRIRERKIEEQKTQGRFPANIILDEFTAGELDKQAPKAGAYAKVKKGMSGKSKGIYGDYAQKGDDGDTFYDDKGGCSRFFYIAKSDKEERNAGLYQFEKVMHADRNIDDGIGGENPRNRTNTNKNNFHPTVKPVKLIQYLVRLVTPKNGISYDPFGGSGTHALASQNEGFSWIMSEIGTEYCDIIKKRIYNNGGLFL